MNLHFVNEVGAQAVRDKEHGDTVTLEVVALPEVGNDEETFHFVIDMPFLNQFIAVLAQTAGDYYSHPEETQAAAEVTIRRRFYKGRVNTHYCRSERMTKWLR